MSCADFEFPEISTGLCSPDAEGSNTAEVHSFGREPEEDKAMVSLNPNKVDIEYWLVRSTIALASLTVLYMTAKRIAQRRRTPPSPDPSLRS